jgi:hypothetical protein
MAKLELEICNCVFLYFPISIDLVFFVLVLWEDNSKKLGFMVRKAIPPYIKDISNNAKKFEICLKRFLHEYSFYYIEEYFQCKSVTS